MFPLLKDEHKVSIHLSGHLRSIVSDVASLHPVMSRKTMLDPSTVFEALISYRPRWPKGRTYADRRGDCQDFVRFVVTMSPVVRCTGRRRQKNKSNCQ